MHICLAVVSQESIRGLCTKCYINCFNLWKVPIGPAWKESIWNLFCCGSETTITSSLIGGKFRHLTVIGLLVGLSRFCSRINQCIEAQTLIWKSYKAVYVAGVSLLVYTYIKSHSMSCKSWLPNTTSSSVYLARSLRTDKMGQHASQNFGFPKRDNYSISHWLQSVEGDPLLNHRTTAELPRSADIVVIGSGVRIPFMKICSTQKSSKGGLKVFNIDDGDQNRPQRCKNLVRKESDRSWGSSILLRGYRSKCWPLQTWPVARIHRLRERFWYRAGFEGMKNIMLISVSFLL